VRSSELRSRGWLLGRGEYVSGKERPNAREREVTADLYLTEGGQFVYHVLRTWSFAASWREEAAVLKSAAELVPFVEAGPASRDAWNASWAKFAPLAPLAMERVR